MKNLITTKSSIIEELHYNEGTLRCQFLNLGNLEAREKMKMKISMNMTTSPLCLVQKQNPLLNLELGTQLASSSTQFVLLWVDFSEIDSKYIAIPILH